MGITSYQKEIFPGVRKTFYMVVAEAINRFSGNRIQKKRRSIPSKPKAELIYKQLWSACREHRPDNMYFTYWEALVASYREYTEGKIRSLENPLGFSPRTVKNKKSRLKHLEKWDKVHLELITAKFVSDFLDKLEIDGMSRANTNELLKEVKCIFAYGVFVGALKSNPFSGMKMRKISKKRLPALNHEEANLLLQEAMSRQHPFYYVWLLTIVLGLRRSELAGLQWIDIEFNQHLLHLRRQKIPGEGLVSRLKDWEERVVAIPDYILPVLKRMKLMAKTDFVIELDCADWNDGHQAKVLRAFCREIGIKELTHHRLRATHITLALADDVLGIVKENVGHAQLSTTDKYFSASGIKMKGQMDRLRIQVPQDGQAVILPLKAVK